MTSAFGVDHGDVSKALRLPRLKKPKPAAASKPMSNFERDGDPFGGPVNPPRKPRARQPIVEAPRPTNLQGYRQPGAGRDRAVPQYGVRRRPGNNDLG